MNKLVNISQLSELSGLSVRNLRTLVYKRIVPFYKTGHRSMWFEPNKVERALKRFEVKEVADRNINSGN